MKKENKKNNKFLKNNLNTIVLVGALLLLMVGLFYVSKSANKVYIKEITMSEYDNIKDSDDAIFYFGTLEGNYNLVKDSAIKGKIVMYYVNIEDLSNEKERIEVWQDKTLKDNYDFSKIKSDSAKKFTINEIDVDTYYKKIETNNINFMVIGQTGCGYCTYYREYINETPLIYGVDVNYIDISKLSESDYNRLVKSDSELNDFGTPLTLIFVNGKRIDYVSGYMPPEQITQTMQKNLILQYLNNIYKD